MGLNGKIPQREETRSEKREQQRAHQYLNELLSIYIDFKNRNCEERGSEILLYHRVMEMYDALNQKWVKFACNDARNHKRAYKFDVKSFQVAVEKHLARHRELCWINYVYRYCQETEKCFPHITQVQKRYKPDADWYLAVTEIKQELIDFIMETLEIPQIKHFKGYHSEVSELSQDEFLYYIELYLQFKAGIINENDAKTLLLLKLADIKYNARYAYLRKMEAKNEKAKEEKLRIDSNIHLLSDNLNNFIVTVEKPDNPEIEPYKDFDLKFTNNLISSIKVKFLKLFKRSLVGPGDALNNSNFYEYRTAHDLYTEYAVTKDDHVLCKLVATLYRPKKWFLFVRKLLPGFNPDIRQKINSKTNPRYLENRAKKIEKLPVQYRLGVYFFFKNCEEFIRYGKPVVNNNEIDLSILYERDPNLISTGTDIGLTGILFALSESGVFGNINETDEQNVWDVIARLYQVCRESKDTKATQEAINKNH